MSLKPLNGRVLVRRLEQAETVGGLYLPDTAREKTHLARVIAVAEDVDEIAPGDSLILGPYQGQTVEVDGEECTFVLAEDILAVVDG